MPTSPKTALSSPRDVRSSVKLTPRRSPRALSRGVTPLAAALAALALGVGACAFWWASSAGASRDEISASYSDASQILIAARGFRAQHADGCPTLSLLEEERFLSRNAREDDAWGNRFRVGCDAAELQVRSAGPDAKPNTADDVRAPR